MAFVNPFQGGQQFADLAKQRRQTFDIGASREARAAEGFTDRQEQQAFQNALSTSQEGRAAEGFVADAAQRLIVNEQNAAQEQRLAGAFTSSQKQIIADNAQTALVNARITKKFVADEKQRAVKNEEARAQEQRQVKQFAAGEERRDTQEARLARADEVAAVERERANQLRAVTNVVSFIKAGVANGVPIEEVLDNAKQPLLALGVTEEQIELLTEQIAVDPGVLDQFVATFKQGAPKRRAVGRPIAVRIGGKAVLLQTFSDGSSEVLEGVIPLAQELAQGRLEVQQQRIDPTAAGALAGAVAEEREVGKTRGEQRAIELDRSRRQIAAGRRAKSSRDQRTELVVGSIDDAIDAAGFFTTGFIGSALSGIGGTDARDLAATLDTIRSNLGFDELQRLRDGSPTGGALGQISERENILLQSTLGSIEQAQSEKQFKLQLGKLKKQIRTTQKRVAEAFEDDFGIPYAGPGTVIPATLAGDFSSMSDEELNAAIIAAGGQ